MYSLDGTKLWEQEVKVAIPANTSTMIWSGKLYTILGDADKNNVVFNLRLTTGEQSHEGNFYLCRQSELKLSKPDIDYEVTPIQGGYTVTLKSDKFVRALYLSLEGEDSRFDDNYFDLIPDKVKKCTVKTAMPIDDFKSKLRMKSLTI